MNAEIPLLFHVSTLGHQPIEHKEQFATTIYGSQRPILMYHMRSAGASETNMPRSHINSTDEVTRKRFEDMARNDGLYRAWTLVQKHA